MVKRNRTDDSAAVSGRQSKIPKTPDRPSDQASAHDCQTGSPLNLSALPSIVDDEAPSRALSSPATLQPPAGELDAAVAELSHSNAINNNEPPIELNGAQGPQSNYPLEPASDTSTASVAEAAHPAGGHTGDGSIDPDAPRAPHNLAPEDVFARAIGTNPFASRFAGDDTILRAGIAVSTWMAGDGSLDFTIVPVENVLELYRPTHALRLLKCAGHPDITTLVVPKGGIVNVALRDPATLSLNPTTGYLRSQENSSWVVASLNGQAAYFANSGIRQICVTPFAHGWHRFVAVLANVFQQRVLYFQSFKGGVTFGTSRFKGGPSTKRKGRQNMAPIDGPTLKEGDTSEHHSFLHRTATILILPSVPVYDGRDQLRLGNYWERPYLEDIKKDAAVMMLFSVKKGALPKAVQDWEDLPRGLTTAVYLNILAIVLLADPVDPFSDYESGEHPGAFGVESVEEELPEYGQRSRVKGEDLCL
ncbi:hypothetical protein BJ322DRAFT_1084037 [Thelephora terrestris]|uniref:Uncharacterized protein n=1 Tax=Thelephora terrestris TaxID=56493 RepID=A0A9P6L2P9_9AGAM|nr:hypothetical protein BJ322DRAFT_1095670 [Thelephora terrestris]KAF9780664.1 hypothetical protein BJ322DRAFT_1084037 [Thelephora terrestris]